METLCLYCYEIITLVANRSVCDMLQLNDSALHCLYSKYTSPVSICSENKTMKFKDSKHCALKRF